MIPGFKRYSGKVGRSVWNWISYRQNIQAKPISSVLPTHFYRISAESPENFVFFGQFFANFRSISATFFTKMFKFWPSHPFLLHFYVTIFFKVQKKWNFWKYFRLKNIRNFFEEKWQMKAQKMSMFYAISGRITEESKIRDKKIIDFWPKLTKISQIFA